MASRRTGGPPLWMVVLVTLALVTVILGGAEFYRGQEERLRERAQVELAAIADLKVDQIVSWRTQHLKTAGRLTDSRLYAQIVANWIDDPGSGSSQGILQRMRAEQPSGDYFDVILVDVEGGERLRLGEEAVDFQVSQHVRVVLGESVAAGRPMLTELHEGPGELPAHLDVIAPLYHEIEGRLVTPGAIVLQSSAADFLYPLVGSWPTPSETAETILVMRDGGDVLYLSDLRHVEGAALQMRVPLTEVDDPVVQAVNGHTGVVEGVDYRGERVFAYVAAVPDSDWFMVAKIDVAEALAEWRERSLFIVLLALGTVSVIVFAFGLAWQSGRAAQLNALLDAERVQRESQLKLLSLFQAAPLGLGVTVDRTFVEVSDYFCQMLGYSSEELIGKESRMIYPDEEEFARVGEALYGSVPDGVCVVEARFQAENGSVLHVFVSTAPIDPEDPTRGMSFAALDITDRKQVEEEVRMHGALLESLVTVAQTPWESAESLWALALDEAVGLTGSAVGRFHLFDESRGVLEREDARALALDAPPEAGRGQLAYLDEACERVAVEHAPVLVQGSSSQDPATPGWAAGAGSGASCLAVPVFADGRLVAVAAVAGAVPGYSATDERRIGVLIDAAWKVVRRHEAEAEVRRINASLEQIVRVRTEDLQSVNEELQRTNVELVDANEAKTRFLRAMSHELRTPLNSIIGFSGIMFDGLAGEVSSEQRHQLEMINRSGRHLLNLINDILDLSRIEAGKVEMQAEDFDASSLAREVFEAISPAAHGKGLETELYVPSSGACVPIHSDPVKVRQVLLNLIGNAVKFTDSGTVALAVECPTPGRVRFAISDTGSGIPAEDHETIFGEFTQRQRTYAVQHEGTGLGLAISRGLASLLGGTISLESTVGEGSTFVLELPTEHQF